MSEQGHHDHHHADESAEGALPIGMGTVEHLVEHLREVLTPKTVLVCVGNELCGDDGAGVVIARQLMGKVPWRVFDTQTVPESFLMKIIDADPDGVLLIDGLHFNAAPGAVELFTADAVTGQGPSTHGPAPLAFLEVLEMMHPCKRSVLGIQAESVEFGTGLSEPVCRAVDMVVEAFVLAAESVPSQER